MNKTSMKRRQFLKFSAMAMAAPIIVPSSVLGQGDIPAPSERIILGHIGVGGQGSGLMRNCLNNKTAQSIAISDCFTSRRKKAVDTINRRYTERFGKAYAETKQYLDYQELLADKRIDGVVIATPDHWHVPIAYAAVKAGKGVYVEKPLSTAMKWSWRLRKLIQDKNAVFQYGTQQRSSMNFRFACELTRNGYIGKLKRIDTWCAGTYPDIFAKYNKMTTPIPVPEDLDYDRWLGPAPKSPYCVPRCMNYGSYFVYDNSLGFIAGWGAHPLDIAQWGNNTDHTVPIEYSGTGFVPTDGLFNTAKTWDMNCRYANGVSMHFMDEKTAGPIISKYRPYKDHGTTFFGDEGWVSVDRGGLHFSDPKMMRIKLKPEDTHLYVSRNQQDNFIECIKTRKPTISPIESAVNSDLISHLCNIAVRLERKIKWDPATESIIDDKEATEMLDRPMRTPWTF